MINFVIAVFTYNSISSNKIIASRQCRTESAEPARDGRGRVVPGRARLSWAGPSRYAPGRDDPGRDVPGQRQAMTGCSLPGGAGT